MHRGSLDDLDALRDAAPALVAAVCHDQIDHLRAAADALLSTHAPVDARRMWMGLFAEWATAKRGMVKTLAAMRRSSALDVDASRREIEGILVNLLAAERDARQLRADVDPADVRSLRAGAMAAAEDLTQTGRLFDLVLNAINTGEP